MNKSCLWLITLVLAALPLRAQISVEIRLEQEQFLPGEALSAAVRITNLSGQTLRLGEEEDWLTFAAESTVTGVVPKLGEVPVVGGFDLPSSKVAIKRVDVAPAFPLDRPGRYTLTATVRVKQWGIEKSSPPKGFDIVEGAKLWQQEFGVPAPAGSSTPPEVRRYVLQQVNYLKGQLKLYVRVTDISGAKTFKVVPVGKCLSFSRPEAQVDETSQLHVLYQNGPRSFSYTKYTPDGDMVMRQTYDYVDSRPRLQLDRRREIAVSGGARRVLPSDIPPPPKTEEASDDKPATPEPVDGKDKAPES